MGYMRDHAIIVSSWSEEKVREAHTKAVEIFSPLYGIYSELEISPILHGAANGHYSFLIPPDGSKEGWDCSNEFDNRRNTFIAWIDEQRYEDGSSNLRWVEVQFADDEHETKVIRHSDEKVEE